METEKLRILLQVVDSGSVQGASRHLGMARSSVRRSLDGLEAEVGTRLLHRDSTGVQLTPAGSVLVARGRPLVDASRAALAETRAAGAEGTGTLRVLEPVGLPLAVRALGLVATRAALGSLRLVIRQVEDPLAHTHEPFDLMLHEGPPPRRDGWFSRVILRTPRRLLASPAWLEAHGTPRSPDDLAGLDTLWWMRPGQSVEELPLVGGGTVAISPWLASPDLLLLRHVAAAGGGLLLGPVAPFLDEPAAPPLHAVLEDKIADELVFRASSPLPSRADPRVRDALAQILELLEALPTD